MDDPEKIKSIADIDRIWIEEGTELGKKDFDQLDLRLRWKPNMQITCTFNPVNAEHWLNTDFWEKWNTENQTLLHTTYRDNRFVWPEYDVVMERLKKQNYNYYKIYALWQWGTLEGLIYEEEWDIIEEIPEGAVLLWYWLDFWFTHPMALIAIYQFEDTVIFDEILYKEKMTNKNLIDFLNENKIWKLTKIIADNARPETITEIYENWFNIHPCSKGKDSVINWINLVKSLKKKVTKRSDNIITEKRKYCWQEDKNGNFIEKPVKLSDDAMDAIRYWCSDFFKTQGKKFIFETI